jgi:hypothetical protein
MLYVIYRDDNFELTYHGGQEPLIHLEADLHTAVAWAENNGVKWAFTDRNAAAAYAGFFPNLTDLDKLNWEAIASTDWQAVKEYKQAEFLIAEHFPWELFERIGVHGQEQELGVANILASVDYKPKLEIRRDWYY